MNKENQVGKHIFFFISFYFNNLCVLLVTFSFFWMSAVMVGASLEVEHASHAPIVCDSHFPTRITDL